MRSASSQKLASLVLATLLAGSSALALPTISDMAIQRDGTTEKVEIQWNEAAPVEINQFAQARQVILVVPGASLGVDAPSRLNTGGSRLFDKARLQEVTLPDGRKGVQVTLQLNQWVQPHTTVTAKGYEIAFHAPDLAPVPAAPASDGLILTDDKITEMENREFGAFDSPNTGAGQAAPSSSALNQYFVPEAVNSDNSAMASTMDLDDLAVQSKLNQNVRRVDFQGTTLENVIRLISEEAELNVMIDPGDVKGHTVTLRLRDVTLRQMLDAILKANDLGYTIEDGGIVRIVPREQVKSTARETVTRTIAINWVKASDLKKALEPFVDTRKDSDGALEVLDATNMIVVRDVPETVGQIQELVRQLDVPEMQVLIEMRLVNMTENASRSFGVRTGYESHSTENRYLRNGDSFFDTGGYANSTSVLNRGLSSSSGSNSTDTVSSSLQDTFDSILGGGFAGTSSTDSSVDSTSRLTNDLTSTSSANTVSSLFATPSSRIGAGALAPGATAFELSNLFTADILGTKYDVDLQINAEETRGEAVTLANPTVLSLNNQEASVQIERKVPYQSAINTDQGSVATVEFQTLGTTVTILPRITNNGYVMMEITPEQVIDRGPGGVGNARLTDETKVESSVIVPDQMTVAVGGLREFSSISGETGVPYLLRVPVLSWLFKNQENTQDKTELYLFVTPQIVRDPTPTPYQMSLYDKIDYNWDLPDYYFDQVMPRKSPAEVKGEKELTKQ